MKMDGKTVLITGSTDGVGRYVAARLAADGAKVLIHGRDCSTRQDQGRDHGADCSTRAHEEAVVSVRSWFEAQAENISSDTVLAQILNEVKDKASDVATVRVGQG